MDPADHKLQWIRVEYARPDIADNHPAPSQAVNSRYPHAKQQRRADHSRIGWRSERLVVRLVGHGRGRSAAFIGKPRLRCGAEAARGL
jgi:hypothetical protein